MRSVAAALAVLLVLGACADGEQRVTGTVVGLDSSGERVESFEVLAEGGGRITFVVPASLTEFEHGGPITHLLQHLQSGVPVRVTYHRDGDVYVADGVGDAGR